MPYHKHRWFSPGGKQTRLDDQRSNGQTQYGEESAHWCTGQDTSSDDRHRLAGSIRLGTPRLMTPCKKRRNKHINTCTCILYCSHIVFALNLLWVLSCDNIISCFTARYIKITSKSLIKECKNWFKVHANAKKKWTWHPEMFAWNSKQITDLKFQLL